MTGCHDDGATVLTGDHTTSVAIIGSPNAGKTTLFNNLCGLRAKTANYPGVTVSRREGTAMVPGGEVTLVDLPGTYSLVPVSPDEEIVLEALEGHVEGIEPPDALMVVADATTLERSLLLVSEVLALEHPTALVLTMMDEVAARHGSVDTAALSRALGIPVVGVMGRHGIGLDEVRELLADPTVWSTPVLTPPTSGIERSGWVASVLESAVSNLEVDRRTRRADAVLLHPLWGTLVFLTAMLLVFQAVFTLAAPAMDFLGGLFDSLAGVVDTAVGGTLGSFLGEGIVAGVGGVLVFLPQIALLFLLLALLEKVGYLARASLLADRVMGRFGLEGRSFVAMLSAFACAIPGIMATRTIPSERRRLATMMAAPLMTCSARLPVYTLLIAAFVPQRSVFGPFGTQGLTMFGLYFLGAISGLIYAGILNATALRAPTAPVMMELPPYRMPGFRSVLLYVWDGVWAFMRKAGTVILLVTAALWVLLNVPRVTPPEGLSEPEAASYQMEHSVAGRVGSALEPVFEPLGFNWQINVALIGSLAAREVFVSTLAVTTASQSEEALPDRLQDLTDSNGDKVFTPATVAALLMFFVYALQCLSTVVVLRRESNSRKWPAVAFGSMFAIAYLAALLAHTVVGALT
ncbi:MAG: ferrous iron transporter B [Microthrixaceae bacterium]|nr:ferrous iron transporter B [Microthrixaceae bacterium]